MTIWTMRDGKPSARRRGALWALWAVLPVLSVGYQVAAKKTAGTLLHVPFGPGWLAQALHLPWGQALIGLEIASFVAWMTVLSEIKLSAAFPLSAFSYVLVIATSWIVFREPADLTQFLGGAGILVGVWLIGRGEPN